MTNFGIEKYMDTLLERQPTRRVGKPSDFTGLVLFLNSVASAHMTGLSTFYEGLGESTNIQQNVLEIDGGSTLSGWRAKKRQQNVN